MKRTMENYLRIFDAADRAIKKGDPCAGCTGCDLIMPAPYDCCVGCPNLGPTGCTTKSIACKLWVCDVRRFSRHTQRHIRRLMHLANKLNMHYARATPEQVMRLRTRQSMWIFYRERY